MQPVWTNLWSLWKKVWYTRFSPTAWLEYLKGKNKCVLEAKSEPQILPCADSSFELRNAFSVCQRSLGCPWTAAQRRIWPLLLHTWSHDRFAKFGTFKHLYLLHPDSSTACWLELAFLPDWIYSIWIRWPFLLYLFALKTINHFKKELSWELSLYLSA